MNWTTGKAYISPLRNEQGYINNSTVVLKIAGCKKEKDKTTK